MNEIPVAPLAEISLDQLADVNGGGWFRTGVQACAVAVGLAYGGCAIGNMGGAPAPINPAPIVQLAR